MVKQALVGLCIIGVTAVASADSHATWTRAALGRLPLFHEDRVAEGKAAQLDEIAKAVADASRGKPLPPQRWSALVLTVGFHESSFSMRIIANDCRRHECDRGKARGFGQVHKNTLNHRDWDDAPGNLAIQAKLTSDALARAYWNCQRSGVEPVRATLSSYAGKGCGASWEGLDKRLATFNRLSGGGGKS